MDERAIFIRCRLANIVAFPFNANGARGVSATRQNYLRANVLRVNGVRRTRAFKGPIRDAAVAYRIRTGIPYPILDLCKDSQGERFRAFIVRVTHVSAPGSMANELQATEDGGLVV